MTSACVCLKLRSPGPLLAEESGSRTHQARLTPLTGFEVRAPHRGAILFRVYFQPDGGGEQARTRQIDLGACLNEKAPGQDPGAFWQLSFRIWTVGFPAAATSRARLRITRGCRQRPSATNASRYKPRLSASDLHGESKFNLRPACKWSSHTIVFPRHTAPGTE